MRMPANCHSQGGLVLSRGRLCPQASFLWATAARKFGILTKDILLSKRGTAALMPVSSKVGQVRNAGLLLPAAAPSALPISLPLTVSETCAALRAAPLKPGLAGEIV